MFAVTISLGSTAWRLLYKEKEKAEQAYAFIFTPDQFGTAIQLEDDFGQRMSASRGAIHGAMLEDLDKTKMANVELYLHQQRVQAMCTKAAQSDPGLRASSMMQSPSIYQPAGLPNN